MLNHLHIFYIALKLFEPLCLSMNMNTNFIVAILSGIIELTSGLNLVSITVSAKLGINVIIAAFLLGFGGISILLQVWSISSKSDISIKPYLLGKLLQGCFAALYTFLIISNISYFKYLLF